MGISACVLGLAKRSDSAQALASAAPPVRNEQVLTFIAGLLLASHFALFYLALQLTTVLRATLLICLVPFFAGLLAFVSFPGSPATCPPSRFWAGLALALIGVRFTVGSPASSLTQHAAYSSAKNLGDVAAVLGAITYAGYMRVGRIVRQRLPVRVYQYQVTRNATVILLPLTCLLYGYANLAVKRSAWPWLLIASLMPQMIGQMGFDYVLAILSPRIVSTFILLEPVVAALLAWVVYGETVSGIQALGSVVVLVGVAVATAPSRQAPTKAIRSSRSTA